MRNDFFSDTGHGKDDQSIWQAFRNGDRLAFEFMYQKNIHHLISYGFKITSDRHVVQDCVQDLFMELWDSRERLTNVHSIRYYLLKSLRYKILKYLKANSMEGLEYAEYEPDGDTAEARLLREESGTQQSGRLLAAIAQLPKRQKEAIHLRYFEELSNEEVARIMGVNYQSACKFIYTALKNLRDVLVLLMVFSFFDNLL